MTKKLYWENPRLQQFSARVEAVVTTADETVVVLDQTAFYPTSGGQPCDLGTLHSLSVQAVSLNENGQILHHLQKTAALRPTQEIVAAIDWKHRLTMMQQHTGQHILSQAFWQLFGAETKGFRINSDLAEIDLALDLQPAEISAAITKAENLANQIVFENRSIRTHLLTPDEAAQLPLRKENFITDCVRVIEIADFDWSPCGGTHAQQTGEVGLIAAHGFERAKKMTRLQFVCGTRALQAFRAANATVSELAKNFSVGRDEALQAVWRLEDENKAAQNRSKILAAQLFEFEADRLLATASSRQGIYVITNSAPQHSYDELKLLAHALIKRPSVLVLFALIETSNARLIFARSENLSFDMNVWMKEFCAAHNGRGGGTADFAQGAVASDNVSDALEQFANRIDT